MKKLFVSLFLLTMISASAYAASVDTFGIGAKATSLGGAVSASSDDVYSIYYNPAGLSQLKGPELSAGIHMADPHLTFHDYTVTDGKGASGNALPDYGRTTFSDTSSDLFIPSLGYAQPITKSISIGVAAYVPFGLDVKWDSNPANNPSAYNWYHSYYIREAVTPTMSYKINDSMSVGVGVSLGRSRSGAEKILKFTAPSEANPAFAGHDTYSAAFAAYLNGAVGATAAAQYTALAQAYAYNGSKLELKLNDDFNYSANIGLLYKPNPNFSAGITYRGRAKADFSGDVTINDVKVTTATMQYDHPEQIQAGIMVKPNPKVSLEMDLVWTRWSINNTQITNFDPALLGSTTYEYLPRSWHDTNQIRIGAEWQVNDLLALRAGYFYDPSPVPDNTFDVMWPDADRKTYSIGAGFNLGKNWTLDTSFQFAYCETKRVIGGESENLNDSYNPPGTTGYRVETSADGYLLGYSATVTYKF